ncbi:MAG TPA: restriction endonuclease subunit S [Candidatus Helicobacter avistercoris]|nr:restriction endonuclease subunit S [Candidatus Helicobacter avistercoris]
MNLHSKHLKTLQTLFAKHPTIAQALLFGSRALGTHKESSDIDIALKGDITPTLLAHLKEELEDSTLPYFCDILDYERAPQELKEHIDTHALTLYKREEEWQEVRLGDIIEIIGGGTPKTSIAEYWNGDIPWLSIADFNNDSKFVYQTEKTITPLGLEKSSTKMLQKGDIIFSARGTVGVVAMLGRDMAFNQSCYGIRAKKEIDKHYLYYLLKSLKPLFCNNAYGSVFDTITKESFSQITIPLPPLERQKEIAEILSSFDDKIDFLHRQNHTLESLAQTLFRHYFIDNAKEEWEEKLLSDFGTIVCGKTPSKNNKSYYGGNYPFIKIPDMHGNIFVFSTADTLTQEGADSQKNKILPPLSICVSCIATVGLVSMNATEAQTNQQINSIIPHKPHYRYYLFLYLQSLYDELHALASGGTATLNLNTGDFSKIKIPMPSDEELLGFHNKIELIFDKIFRNMFSQQKTLFLSKKLLRELIAKI